MYIDATIGEPYLVLFVLLQERHMVVDQVSMQLPNLIGAAGITFKLVIRAQGLRGREVAETVGHARVLKHGQLSTSRFSLIFSSPHLVHIYAEVTKLFMLACHRLTVQTSCLAC